MNLLIIDIIEDRYHVQYNKDTEKVLLYDKISLNVKELKIKYNRKRDTNFVRFSYTVNGKRKYYHKTLRRIKWELFGEWDDGNKPLVGLTKETVREL